MPSAARSARRGAIAASKRSNVAPQLLTYETPGPHSFVTPAGSGYRIDRVALGSGKAGSNYVFGRAANGGYAGMFAWDTLTEGVDFTAGATIDIAVGAGGLPSEFPNVTTISVNGNTLTGQAWQESGFVSGYTGQSVNTGNTNGNKDLLLNGNTYVGGSGGTSSASNDSAAAPLAPGGGGWGSNTNGVSGRPGGNGRAWLNVYQ